MTRLATIFQNPIDRHIEGVIKADDKASLRQEVEEYVLTNEVAKRLESFLDAYNNYQGANGVWISGFFGSGKSHLLKMLAMLLGNQALDDGIPVLDLFLPKCGDNEILRGDLKRAVSIPSQSILFNIDQKADVISKTEMDAVLAVFAKVFDELCGYYGKQGHIAQFERDLNGRSLFTPFQQAYEEIAGFLWTDGREQALLEGHNIAAAYAQVTGVPASEAQGILDKYRAQYKMSIEDFAEQVKTYVTSKGANFRLNFFVDEVGQYIANNTKLMTNLQTIAESLATKCQGQAWIIVTAQEEMDSVIGEMGKQQGQDFSKIQDRFKNRMKLTSADVAEVIQKRLLLKNKTGVQQLTAVYDQQHNNFKTLFDFADGAQIYRNFRDRDHFIHSYPFIPYQFPLFQAAIQGLSDHNAFEGKNRSVGERSMLGVFQQVAVQIADKEIGNLATFDLMFEGIRTTLKSNIQQSITQAEQHLDDPFAVRMLKALFLVKYVKSFRATLRNLTVLMSLRFEADLPDLRQRLQAALNLLEQQTYIQRNGEQYQYLTDEEKDVEQEIKQTDIDNSVIADELGKLVFDTVIRERKIRYEESGQDYPFSRKLDDRLMGREYELSIHVITPFHQHTGNKTVLLAQAMGRDELLVIMPTNDRLLRDLTLYKQTEKYTLQNTSITQQDNVRRILTDKQIQNQERLAALRELVQDLLLKADLIVAGQELEFNGSDARSRITRGFQELVTRTYPHLRMLRVTYSENEIGRFLQPETNLFGDDAATFSEAEQEMLAFVNSNDKSGLRTTLQTVVNQFERKPYGWYLAAIQCILAKLCTRGKIELLQDSNPLEDQALEHAIRNTRGYGNILLKPQIAFTSGQLRQLRDFYAEFFDAPPQANEAKTLGQETAVSLHNRQQELATLRQQAAVYPFLTALDNPIVRLEAISRRPYTFYLTDLRQYENELLDLKEAVIEPILRFMNGAQKGIYDAARDFLRDQEANFSYVNSDSAQQLRMILDDPHCYAGNKIQRAKTLLDGLQTAVSQYVQQEKSATQAKVDARWQRLTGMGEFIDLNSDQQAQLEKPFSDLKQSIGKQTLIDVIHGLLRRFDETSYNELLRQMTVWANPPAVTDDGDSDSESSATADAVAEPRPILEIVPQRTLTVPFTKAWLADEADVKAYLAALEKVMLAAINDGKRIQI